MCANVFPTWILMHSWAQTLASKQTNEQTKEISVMELTIKCTCGIGHGFSEVAFDWKLVH